MASSRIVSSKAAADVCATKITGKTGALQSSSTATASAGTNLSVNDRCVACEKEKSNLLQTYGDIANKDAEKIQMIAQSFADLDSDIAAKTRTRMR